MGGFNQTGGRGRADGTFANRERRVIASTNEKGDLPVCVCVCVCVCLSGYTFRHALTSHANILDVDRGHIFRKHRHKIN